MAHEADGVGAPEWSRFAHQAIRTTLQWKVNSSVVVRAVH